MNKTPSQLESSKRYYAKNREKILAKCAIYRAKNKEKTKAAINRWNKENAEYVRQRRILKQYGISADDLRKLDEMRKDGCQICGQKTRLCIDHDHSTGMIRGLLCIPCNRSLGNFGDNLEAIERVRSYLIESIANPPCKQAA